MNENQKKSSQFIKKTQVWDPILENHLNVLCEEIERNMHEATQPDKDLTANEILALFDRQEMLEKAVQWIIRVNQVKNPTKLVTPGNNGMKLIN